jgi:phage terminase small subunit
MKGRKPKPAGQQTGHRTKAELAKRNSFSADPLASKEPPTKLKGLALKCWNELVVSLDRAGVLAQTDTMSLLAVCETFAEGQRAYAAMQKRISEDERERFFHQWLKALDSFRKFAVEHGLTPSSRTRVQAQKSKQVDELDSILDSAEKSARLAVQ